jgi:type II secretory pathway pseudopilin PulG
MIRSANYQTVQALSLTELLVVVTVITILAAVVIPQMVGLSRPAEQAAAQETMERVNRAINLHEQSQTAITVSPTPGFADEMAVLALLQTRDDAIPGSPFLDANLRYPQTSDDTRPRGFWDGEYFRLLTPGEEGSGLDFARPYLEN